MVRGSASSLPAHAVKKFVEACLGNTSFVEMSVRHPSNRWKPLSSLSALPAPTMHLGASYISRLDGSSSRRSVANFLCFDIDATDFPRRDCCGAQKVMCERCWPLVASSAMFILWFMYEEFGASVQKNGPLVTLSGGRGIHLRFYGKFSRYTDEIREGIASYIERSSSANGVAQKMLDGGVWDIIAEKQDWPPDGGEEALKFARDAGLDDSEVETYAFILDTSASKAEFWKDLAKSGNTALLKIVAHYASPRFDAPVTKQRAHMMRMPLSIHERTGQVCMPVPLSLFSIRAPPEPRSVEYGARLLLYLAKRIK